MRRAACLFAVLALAGCGSEPPGEPRPPFPVIGSFTGEAWRAIGPGLGGVLDPSSPNPCMAGSARCMPAVVHEMSLRLGALAARCDHRAPFLLMYRQVSREVRDSVRARRYRDPAYVAHLDAVFATLYFHAADAWRLGRRDEVPRAWRLAFAAAERREVSALGDMLLGMNAHISRDLPYALAAVGLDLRSGRDATPDVTAINDDIDRAQAPMLRDVAAKFDPTVARVREADRWVEPARIRELIARWREEASRNARRLLAADSPAERRRVERSIDRNAATRSLLIWRATRYEDPTREARARAEYCARARA